MAVILNLFMGLSLVGLIIGLVLVYRRVSVDSSEGLTDVVRQLLRDESERQQSFFQQLNQANREEIGKSVQQLGDGLLKRMTELATLQKNQLDSFAKQLAHLTQTNDQKLETVRQAVENRLKSLQEDNAKKLDSMRQVVDEKLHATLEKRLGESFKLVSDRLEQVHKGLGEMQNLATGVGDLKRVLTNVKTRGTWGEIQLGALLEQILSPEQYGANVATKKRSSERVEFAIKLPGRDQDKQDVVWLPVDSKFPQEDYLKLVDAQDRAQPALVEEAARQLEQRIKKEARTIRDKYIEPPQTTDFAIMFLPSEGLYAEVLRRGGLSEQLQREYRIVLTGPTTLAALLNSLQMGFRTLAIEKRSSDVWQILAGVKTEFGKFGDLLDKTHKKLQEASNTIETASRKSRTIERKLKNVQSLPVEETPKLSSGFVEDDLLLKDEGAFETPPDPAR